MEDLLNKRSSLVYRRAVEPFGDMSELGLTYINQDFVIKTFPKKWHDEFKVLDALYYNAENKEFELAIARNTKQCEVCGLVYSVGTDTFQMISSGYMPYNNVHDALTYPDMAPMYLSETIPGALTFQKPSGIVKRVAVFRKSAIMITIDTGMYWAEEDPMWNQQESYTQEELDDIVSKLWWDRRH